MPQIDLSILNQRQTPAFYADVFANRPAAGFVGRIFVSTNTFAFYRDNGTGWDLIGGPGTGTITGSGASGQIALWDGASTITGDTGLTYNGTANSLTASQFIVTGGTSSQFLKANGSLDSNTYNTGSGAVGQVTFWNGTNAITGGNDLFWDSANGHLGVNTNVPGTALDVHHDQPTVAILNQTVATNDVRIGFQNNGVGLWRIGAFYNAGANDFGIYDTVAAIQPVTVKKTTGQVLIGTSTVGSGKLVVASTTGDNGIQIVGATAPSLRIDNAESGPTKRIGLGISTAVNNFIQGSVDRDMCIFNGSTTASPMLFGIYDTTNVQEAARISAARNFLIGTTTDVGSKLQVNGQAYINHNDASVLRILRNGGSNTNTGIEFVNAGSSANIGSNGTLFGMGGTNGSIPAQPFIIVPSGSEKIRLDANGNFGIGTNGPATTLEVLGVNEGEYFRGGGGTISDRSLRLSNYTISGTVGIGHRINNPNSGGSLNFAINSNDAIIIRNTLNVLIGTTNDNGEKLQVNGRIQSTGFKSFTGTTIIASGATQTAYTIPSGTGYDGLYFVQVEITTGSNIYLASGVVTALAGNNQAFLTTFYQGPNVVLSVSGLNIQITNAGFSTFTWNYTILFQPL
jgi:hypothetical protein